MYAKRIEATKSWRNAAILYHLRYFEQAASDYSELYPYLKDQAEFLLEYGHSFHQIKEYAQSNVILLEGTQLSSDPMFYNVIGSNYKELGDVIYAEKNYLYAFEILPNRIYPLYLLMKLYADTGQQDRALEMAQKVIDFIPKVDSHVVRDMKNEAKELFP